jgi:hypothetical protein
VNRERRAARAATKNRDAAQSSENVSSGWFARASVAKRAASWS